MDLFSPAPGLLAIHRPTIPGDEFLFLPEETEGFARSVVDVKRQSAAARIAARDLLSAVGFEGWPLPKKNGQAPDWPAGVVGSIAHCNGQVAAIIGRKPGIQGVGIDIEPDSPITEDVFNYIITPREREEFGYTLTHSRVLFCAKEATFKAVSAFEKQGFNPQEIHVDLLQGIATTSSGHSVNLALHRLGWVIVCAWLTGE